LCGKLNQYGVRGLPLNWLKSYLCDRVQVVRVGDGRSVERVLNIGVPQGSILGPLLFLIYINDLPNVSSQITSILFADDTTLLNSSACFRSVLNTFNDELIKVGEWCRANRLTLNVSKTFAMHFSTLSSDVTNPVMILDGQLIQFQQSGSFLGVLLDRNLKFSLHIDAVVRKVSKTVGIFYKLQNVLPEKTLVSLYYSFVYPYFLYCNAVWGSSSDTFVNRLFLVQKKIVRIITHSSYLEHTTPLFCRTNILKVIDIHKFIIGQYMYKDLRSSNPRFFVSSSQYSTRSVDYVVPHFHRLALTQRSVTFVGPTVWNNIPLHIRQARSLSRFKFLFRRELLSHYC